MQHGRGPRLWFAQPCARQWRTTAPAVDTPVFHRRWPGYAVTPLIDVPELAGDLGVGRVLVKHETSRLGLPAFKALGVSWAVSRVLGEGAALSTLDEMRAAAVRTGTRLVTATDGNHGRALARTAALLGVPATVFVPHDCPAEARRAIESEGATVIVVAGSYDQAVAAAADAADAGGGTLVQDTAWPGYERVPGWIVEGYGTLVREVDDGLGDLGLPGADLVVVPAGVGSLVQAVLAHARSGRAAPSAVLAVEPTAAPCITTSLLRGELTTVPNGRTTMNGLNCQTPSSLAWPILRNGLDAAIAVDDEETARAVCDLAARGIDAGPSGAASLAGVRAALEGRGGPQRRSDLGLGPDAVVVLLVTEARQAVESEEAA